MKTIGNYTRQDNRDFPLDAEGLLAIQDNIATCEMLGNIAGDKMIVMGCEITNDGKHAPGYIFLRTERAPKGEVLYFEGGAGDSMYIKSTAIAISAEQREYPEAYTERCLASGIDLKGTTYKWADFTLVSTNKVLRAQIVDLTVALGKIKPAPAGVIEIYAGAVLPDGYLLCNGQDVSIADYAELYKAIGDMYNLAPNWSGVTSAPPVGRFKIPDLRSRFVVGYNGDDADYNTLGKAGGAKNVTLSVDQIPAHNHISDARFNKLTAKQTEASPTTSVATTDTDKSGFEYTVSGMTPDLWTAATVKSVGGGMLHENRPPYYALSYIIKTGK